MLKELGYKKVSSLTYGLKIVCGSPVLLIEKQVFSWHKITFLA